MKCMKLIWILFPWDQSLLHCTKQQSVELVSDSLINYLISTMLTNISSPSAAHAETKKIPRYDKPPKFPSTFNNLTEAERLFSFTMKPQITAEPVVFRKARLVKDDLKGFLLERNEIFTRYVWGQFKEFLLLRNIFFFRFKIFQKQEKQPLQVRTCVPFTALSNAANFPVWVQKFFT